MLYYKVKWQIPDSVTKRPEDQPAEHSPVSYGLTRRIGDLETVTPWLWNFEVPSEPYMEIVIWDVLVQYVDDRTELISRASCVPEGRLCWAWQSGGGGPKGAPSEPSTHMTLHPGLGRAPGSAFESECPGLHALPSGWAFPKALQSEARATMPFLTQCCATFKPGPGTSRPLPKASQQSRTVLWTGLPATLSVRPMCRARPHPLCLDSLGYALGHLFCPFLSGAVVIIFTLSMSSQCAVNFC